MHPNSTPSRQQFVAVCECGCGAPVLLAAQDSRGLRRGQPLRFLRDHQCRGSYNARWHGGRSQHTEGYVEVKCPDHPYAMARGYVLAHRLVMEAHLGRYLLPHEIVHHVDGDKTNNAISNLAVMTRAEHQRMHTSPRWSRKHERCIGCGTSDKTAQPHEAYGYCGRCYERIRRTG